MPKLADDPLLKRARGRRDNPLDLKDIIEKWLKGFATRDEAGAELDKERVPCAPVLTVNEAMNHPHLNERKTVKWIDDPLLGKVAVPSVPVKFSSWPDRTAVRTARLGETTSARCTNCSG
jgi:CoA:oxalate CoA-transferase